MQIDTRGLALHFADRIRSRGEVPLTEGRASKTASVSSKRRGVLEELAQIDYELSKLETNDRQKVLEELGKIFGVGARIGSFLTEASNQEITKLDSRWVEFLRKLGA